MQRSSNPDKFLTDSENVAVRYAIKDAEKCSSAEIKFVIARHCWDDIRRKAVKVFKKLGLCETEDRNCVLILLVVTNREFVIFGDVGIDEKVGQDFWDDVRNVMSERFKEDRFGEGICNGAKLIGGKLATYFPSEANDSNEISDEINYEE